MAQSKELTKFYQEYALWLEEGAPDKLPFWRQFGLCGNYKQHLLDGDLDNVDEHLNELTNQFEEANLMFLFPFNISGDDYNYESDNGVHHLNEKRIAWVHQHMKG